MSKAGFKSYIQDASNQVDVLVFFVFIIYACCCISYPQNFLPGDPSEAGKDLKLYETETANYYLQFWMPIMNAIMCTLTFVQLLRYF